MIDFSLELMTKAGPGPLFIFVVAVAVIAGIVVEVFLAVCQVIVRDLFPPPLGSSFLMVFVSVLASAWAYAVFLMIYLSFVIVLS